jgi:hypothetical protein
MMMMMMMMMMTMMSVSHPVLSIAYLVLHPVQCRAWIRRSRGGRGRRYVTSIDRA